MPGAEAGSDLALAGSGIASSPIKRRCINILLHPLKHVSDIHRMRELDEILTGYYCVQSNRDLDREHRVAAKV
jgi:hypothetical protein